MIRSYISAAAAIIFSGISAYPAKAEVTTAPGSYDHADLSGNRGDDSEILELSRGKGVIAITGEKSSQGTCSISIEGKRLALNADYESDEAGDCRHAAKEVFNTKARFGNYITGFRVCTSRTPFEMVTGIEIESLSLDKNGEFGTSAPSERDWGDHCDRWQSWSRCDPGQVLVGVEVHLSDFPDTPSGNAYVAGMAALCQDVLSRD